MRSETPIKLPLIDFSKIYLNESTRDDWNSVKTQVHQALTEYGFFRASMSGMSPEFRTSLFGSLDQLFDLPLEKKLKSISDKPFHGYIGNSPTMPLYESMAIPDAPIPGEVENFTNFIWPQGNLEFRFHKYTFLYFIYGQYVLLASRILLVARVRPRTIYIIIFFLSTAPVPIHSSMQDAGYYRHIYFSFIYISHEWEETYFLNKTYLEMELVNYWFI